ncbi:hypothetical protein [Planktotalea sp.]|uniref:hypothetical protein n=1 Tax=Planktotalea sp. TaxID=2029877 RepID=UPI003D6AFC07
MRLFQLSTKSAALLLAMTGSTWADQFQTVTRPEVAAKHCNTEWSRFEALNPNAWSKFPPFEIDPNIEAATTEALNKYEIAVIALADYFGSFLGFADAENQNPAYFSSTRARYDLAMCLFPTKPERNLVLELARTKSSAPDAKLRTDLFGLFDRFECMQVAKASEVIFDLDPTRQPFSFDFKTITNANMKKCS